jgi:hypothetical protein
MKMIQLGILGMVLAVGAQGASIAIANAGFEDNVLPVQNFCGLGCDFKQGVMSGWSILPLGSDAGTWRPGPPTTVTFFDSVPEGVNIGYAQFGAALRQIVGETAVAGLTYTLEVDLGWRKDYGASSIGFIELVVGTTRVLATGTTPTQGGWSKYTATYAAVAGDTGKTIEIYLGSTANQLGNFDNVRLNSSGTPVEETNPVPEPAGMGVVGLAGLVLAGRYWKGRG